MKARGADRAEKEYFNMTTMNMIDFLIKYKPMKDEPFKEPTSLIKNYNFVRKSQTPVNLRRRSLVSI